MKLLSSIVGVVGPAIAVSLLSCTSAFADTPAAGVVTTTLSIGGQTYSFTGAAAVTIAADGSVTIKPVGAAAAAPPKAATLVTSAPVAVVAAPSVAVTAPPISSDPKVATAAAAASASAKKATAAAQAAAGAQAVIAANAAAAANAADAADAANVAAQTASTATTPDAATAAAQTAKAAADAAEKAANSPSTPSASSIFLGAGLAISGNIGSSRADSIKFITRADGQLLAQVQTSQNVNINLLAETHYLFKHMHIDENTNDPLGVLGDLITCGPWAFVQSDSDTSGCGPLFLASVTSNQSTAVTQFGIGWALGVGGSSSGGKPGVGLGFGLLIDPNDKVIDQSIIDTNTMLVKSQYQSGVANGTINALVTRPTASLFFMVSKAF